MPIRSAVNCLKRVFRQESAVEGDSRRAKASKKKSCAFISSDSLRQRKRKGIYIDEKNLTDRRGKTLLPELKKDSKEGTEGKQRSIADNWLPARLLLDERLLDARLLDALFAFRVGGGGFHDVCRERQCSLL